MSQIGKLEDCPTTSSGDLTVSCNRVFVLCLQALLVHI